MLHPHQFGFSNAFRSFVIFVLIFSFHASFAQQSSLAVNAINVDQEPASGFFILQDNESQDSTWKVPLQDGTAYFPFYTVGIDDNYLDESISIYPNPIGSGANARIVISDDFQLEFLRIYDNTGKLLYVGESPIDAFRVNSGVGLLLIQFQNDKGQFATKELVSNVETLTFIVSTETSGIKKSTHSNSYTLTFEDQLPSDPEFDDHTEQISMEETEHKVLDVTLAYAPKTIIVSGTTSPDAQGTVKTGEETLGAISIGDAGEITQQAFQYAFSKEKTLPIVIVLTDDNAIDITITRDAHHNIPLEIDAVLTYNFGLSGTACSPVGALVEVYDEGMLVGSDVLGDAGEYQINWTSQVKSVEIDSIRLSSSGYYNEVVESSVLNAGSNTHVFSLNSIDAEADYVRAYGLITASNGTGTNERYLEVILTRKNNPSESYTVNSEGTGGYDFGTTIPVYNSPENYTLTIIPPDGIRLKETTHQYSYTDSPVNQRYDVVINSLPNQKIQGTIRDADDIDTRLEGVTVKFMRASDDTELDATTTDVNGYYISNIELHPNTEIYLLIGGKAGYYSRGGTYFDWRYTVSQPMYAVDTLVTFNWTLPRIVGKYGSGTNDTITVSAFDIMCMVKGINIEHAMGRGALFNFEQLIRDNPAVSTTIVNNWINEFKAAFPNVNIVRTTNTHELTTQEMLEYDYKTNFYSGNVITHVVDGINYTHGEYTTCTGYPALLISYMQLGGVTQEAFNKEVGRALGFGEVGYLSFMWQTSQPITNRDKRVANLILRQGQYRYYDGYDSFSYKNLTEDIDE